jgi:hypothetical protein
MATKLTYQDFRTLIGGCTDKTLGNSEKAHYTLGALESILANVAADLPLKKQLELARSVGALQERLKDWT